MKKLLRLICRWLCGSQPEPTKPETLLTYKEVVMMLSDYDNTRLDILADALGFEDSRVNTFDFYELKNYLEYTENLAREKGIKLKGVSFVKGVYNKEMARDEELIGYENLMYIPTTMINGKEVLVDVINSKKEEIVTFKEKLREFGYEWRYDNKKNYKFKNSKKQEKQEFKKQFMMMNDDNGSDTLSGASNHSTIAPPYEAQ